jgi:hypothetical protein
MPSKSSDEKSDKNLKIFVVGGGVEPPAQDCSGPCST